MPKIDSQRLVEVVADPSGFTLTGLSGVNAAQTLNQLMNSGEFARITGFEVTLIGLGAPIEATISVLGAGALLWQSFVPSGSTTPTVRDFRHPVTVATAGASVNLFVGAAGASIRTVANLRGYGVRDEQVRS